MLATGTWASVVVSSLCEVAARLVTGAVSAGGRAPAEARSRAPAVGLALGTTEGLAVIGGTHSWRATERGRRVVGFPGVDYARDRAEGCPSRPYSRPALPQDAVRHAPRPGCALEVLIKAGRRPFSSEGASPRHRRLPLRVDAGQLLDDGVHRRADLLLRVGARQEEAQARELLFHRRVDDRLHVDAALEQVP